LSVRVCSAASNKWLCLFDLLQKQPNLVGVFDGEISFDQLPLKLDGSIGSQVDCFRIGKSLARIGVDELADERQQQLIGGNISRQQVGQPVRHLAFGFQHLPTGPAIGERILPGEHLDEDVPQAGQVGKRRWALSFEQLDGGASNDSGTVTATYVGTGPCNGEQASHTFTIFPCEGGNCGVKIRDCGGGMPPTLVCVGDSQCLKVEHGPGEIDADYAEDWTWTVSGNATFGDGSAVKTGVEQVNINFLGPGGASVTVENPACGSTGWGFVIDPCTPPIPPEERDCAAMIVGGSPFICVDDEMSLQAQLWLNGTLVPSGSWSWTADGSAVIQSSSGDSATVLFDGPDSGTITAQFNGGECSGKSASFSAQALAVDFTPDPDTHLDDTAVTILPSDAELVLVELPNMTDPPGEIRVLMTDLGIPLPTVNFSASGEASAVTACLRPRADAAARPAQSASRSSRCSARR